MNLEDLLVFAVLFFLLVGVPTFLIYKLGGAVVFNGIIFTALFLWAMPEFSLLPTALYFIFLVMTMSANHSAYRFNQLSEEEKEIEINNYTEGQLNKDLIICPNCSSKEVEFMGNNRKSFSVGKAVGGAALTGGIGTLAGFAGKKGKTDKWHCKECGNVFDK